MHQHSSADHGHTHHDSHGHGHHHAHHVPLDVSRVQRAFLIGVLLNAGFVVLELGYGFFAHSLALLADAVHNFGDVIGLLLAFGASALAQRAPSARFTYGLRGTTILAALANAVLLLVVTGAILLASLDRLRGAVAVDSQLMIWVALTGVGVNLVSAWLFMRGRKQDLNVEAAFVHMAGDAAIAVGVVVSGIVIGRTGWLWLDPCASIAIAVAIVWGAWGLLRESLHLAVQGVPIGIDAPAVRAFLTERPGVRDAHDLHIWAMSTTENAMTAHLVMPAGHPGDEYLETLAAALDERFGLCHVTLQVETGDGSLCRLAAEHSV